MNWGLAAVFLKGILCKQPITPVRKVSFNQGMTMAGDWQKCKVDVVYYTPVVDDNKNA